MKMLCYVCFNDNEESSCNSLKLPYLEDISLKRQFIEIAASLVDDKIFLRCVYATNGSSIDVFEPSGKYQYERVKTTEDLIGLMSEHTVVAAFSTSTHTYFVGSAKRADLALKGSNDGSDFDSTRKNSEIRITRICNNDHTNLLDSRIDLVLSCDNIDYQDIENAVENYATAASYLPDNQKLLVAMRNGKTNSTICEYNFTQIQERFDETWNSCQNTVSGKDTEHLLLDPKKFDNALMWRPARAGAHMLEFIKAKNQLLFVDPRTDNTINFVQLSCKELYHTCQNISWDDPLNCGFCVNPDGTGIVMNKNKLLCSTGNILENVCPPVIKYFNINNGGILIEGMDFKKLQKMYIKVCEEQCIVDAHEDAYIRCNVQDINEKRCNLTIIGALNQYPAFALRKAYDSTGVTPTTQNTGSNENKSSRLWRYLIYVLAVAFLLALIIGVYCLIKCKTPKKKIQDRGNSAVVHLGHFIEDLNKPTEFIQVAIKTARSDSSMQFEDFKKEIQIMKNCKHENIVKFIGWTHELDSIYIVTEFMGGGNVHSYLKDGQNRPTIGQCFSYISQILEGMAYLSHRHIIHRDLATRNCLLNSTYEIVKISDFGLSRKSDMNYEYLSHHDIGLPFRWIPLEALYKRIFSTKGDVWSFAVVVWELFQRGAVPYSGLDMTGVREFLSSGMRLHRPEYCPEELYALMLSCWDEDPDKRPSFETLKVHVIDILFQYTATNPEQVQSEYERPTSSAVSSAAPTFSIRQTSISGNTATTAL
uniref:receptor protein-tyrosine kinase n=1 Tax=Panagrolaimus superbus TaxID=310955 RepID=A0A914Z7U9_9BILA